MKPLNSRAVSESLESYAGDLLAESAFFSALSAGEAHPGHVGDHPEPPGGHRASRRGGPAGDLGAHHLLGRRLLRDPGNGERACLVNSGRPEHVYAAGYPYASPPPYAGSPSPPVTRAWGNGHGAYGQGNGRPGPGYPPAGGRVAPGYPNGWGNPGYPPPGGPAGRVRRDGRAGHELIADRRDRRRRRRPRRDRAGGSPPSSAAPPWPS